MGRSCHHWIELDNAIGHLYEYCRGAQKKCTCAGTESQCSYPSFFKVYEAIYVSNCPKCGFVSDKDVPLCPDCGSKILVCSARKI